MKTIVPVVIGAIVMMTGPALAGQSTPQEREATRQLNLEAAQQAKNTNQQLAAANIDTKSQDQAAPAAAPSTPVESAPAPAPSQNADQPAKPDAAAQ